MTYSLSGICGTNCPTWGTDIVRSNTRLFLEFANCGLLECLAVLDAAGHCPEVLAGKCAGPVTEEQNPSGMVHHEQFGGWSAA